MDIENVKSQPDSAINPPSSKLKKIGKRATQAFFGISWILFLLTIIVGFRAIMTKTILYVSPYEYARWVTSPDRSQTAILVRDYFFDLNFRLFIVDMGTREIPTNVKEAIWASDDYPLVEYVHYFEDIEWSHDSTVVAVIIENEYVFAYDFSTSKKLDEPEAILMLLEEHSLSSNPD